MCIYVIYIYIYIYICIFQPAQDPVLKDPVLKHTLRFATCQIEAFLLLGSLPVSVITILSDSGESDNMMLKLRVAELTCLPANGRSHHSMAHGFNVQHPPQILSATIYVMYMQRNTKWRRSVVWTAFFT